MPIATLENFADKGKYLLYSWSETVTEGNQSFPNNLKGGLKKKATFTELIHARRLNNLKKFNLPPNILHNLF